MEKVTKIINDWDPVGFFLMAPKDEYKNEIKKICEYVHRNPNLCIQNLAETINRIFAETFGTDVYDENIQACMLIAEKILNTKEGDIVF